MGSKTQYFCDRCAEIIPLNPREDSLNYRDSNIYRVRISVDGRQIEGWGQTNPPQAVKQIEFCKGCFDWFIEKVTK